MGKTRSEKVERMLDSVNYWDEDAMVSHIQGTMEENFKRMSDDMLDQEYIDWFGDDGVIEDGEIFEPEQPTEESCACGRMKDIGHKCWWCGGA